MLIIYRKKNNEVVLLIDYLNANYVSDKSDRKSIINQIFMLKDESIS